MRPFYLLSAAAIVAVSWFVYTKFLAKDPGLQPADAALAQNVAVTQSRGLSPEQIRNREQLIRTYERRIQESRSTRDKTDTQKKIDALRKEIAGT